LKQRKRKRKSRKKKEGLLQGKDSKLKDLEKQENTFNDYGREREMSRVIYSTRKCMSTIPFFSSSGIWFTISLVVKSSWI
jgi:hypothetical protein